MINSTFRETDIEALRDGRFHHSDPRLQGRMAALDVRSQRVANRDIPRPCGLANASFQRYLHA